jgi:hypothetical protein
MRRLDSELSHLTSAVAGAPGPSCRLEGAPGLSQALRARPARARCNRPHR